MKDKMRHRSRIYGVLLLILLLLIVPVMGADSSTEQAFPRAHSLSPVNPRYTRFINEEATSNLDYIIDSTSAMGLVPTTVDLSFTKGTRISDFGTRSSPVNRYSTLSSSLDQSSSATYTPVSSLPGRFDLRTFGKVSAVKNQGQCGSCWAFSTFASLESALLGSESWDFSENNLRNSHGYDLYSCQGGNSLMATAYLARWSGALTESTDPYSTISKSASSVTSPNTGSVKHVQEVLFIPDRSGALDNENIKRVLSVKGAIYSTIRWEDSSYRSSTASYYYKGSSPANHAITIVGWDDSYDRNRFSTKPAGDGAFIVKNSWGSSWGENGYFYVSYYDTWIGKDNAFFSAEGADNYYHNYQYDPLGWVVSFGENSPTEYFANVFTAQSAENVAAVSFYTATTDAQYQVSVYRGVQNSPVKGTAVISESGTIGVPGYHTIALSSPVPVEKGERFSVVVKLTTPGYQYPVAIEYPLSGFSSGARATSGQSFVSSSGTSWTDLNSIYPNSNVCLKAFTTQGTSYSTVTPTSTPDAIPTTTPMPTTATSDTRVPAVTITAPRPYSSISPGSLVQVAWSSQDNIGVAGVDIEYSNDQGKTWVTAAVNLSGAGTYSLTVPADASGTFIIRVRAIDSAGNEGSSTRSCIVKSSSQVRYVLGMNATSTPSIPVTHSITLRQTMTQTVPVQIPTTIAINRTSRIIKF
jgi:C1A family cysteine protease